MGFSFNVCAHPYGESVCRFSFRIIIQVLKNTFPVYDIIKKEDIKSDTRGIIAEKIKSGIRLLTVPIMGVKYPIKHPLVIGGNEPLWGEDDGESEWWMGRCALNSDVRKLFSNHNRNFRENR